MAGRLFLLDNTALSAKAEDFGFAHLIGGDIKDPL
jgi:hypothetical protein